jgi:ribosomal protein S18 acetylase RimI-like enzyme
MVGSGGAAASTRVGGPRVESVVLRNHVEPADAGSVPALVERTGFFNAAEIGLARELVQEHLARGADSGYLFVLAGEGNGLAGFACFGPIPATRSSWDLYWIAVDPASQRHGLGRRLLAAVERAVTAAGGERLYADTSSRAQYVATQRFYRATGFRLAAELPGFYAPDDGKLIFEKGLAAPQRAP